MKHYVDAHRSERSFDVDDWVFLRLQPYRQTSLAIRRDLKLAPKFYGPYQVIEKIGSVAYKLQLPTNSSIHPVFHVSMLEKQLGQHEQPDTTLLSTYANGLFRVEPIAILDRRLIRRGNLHVAQVLVQWFNVHRSEATWEDYDKFTAQFPQLDP